MFPKLCPEGIDLLERMFEYDPAKRITVRAAAGRCRLRLAAGVGGALARRASATRERCRPPACPSHPPAHPLQAKEAMEHPYFDDFPERDIVDALENPSLVDAAA